MADTPTRAEASRYSRNGACGDFKPGTLTFKNAWGHKLLGAKKLECVPTVSAGKVRIRPEQPGLFPPDYRRRVRDREIGKCPAV
jgi:hypothetical protein